MNQTDTIDIENPNSVLDTGPVDTDAEKHEGPPPSYYQAGKAPPHSPLRNHTFTPSENASTKSKGVLDIIILLFSFAAWCIVIVGIAESVVYAVYYSNYRYILPFSTVLIPIIGGGPVQVFLGLLALIFSRISRRHKDSRFILLPLALILSLNILCGLVIPAVSLGLNKNASDDITSIVNALQTAPPGVLEGYADMFQSCTYNLPANQTTSPLNVVPQYLDPNCKYADVPCTVPVQSCTYSFKAYVCTDLPYTQSNSPCNVLGRVVYQVSYDWNKLGKQVDIWAMGVWGFWVIVYVVFCVREYL